MSNKTPTVLCILDGFGLNPDIEGNAVRQANPKHFLSLWDNYPHTQLFTHGERVGLPAGQMGNSEVGHMNIGAGRVVEQWLVRIGRLLKEDALPAVNAYKNFITDTQDSKTIHIIGLCSNGGVHSHINHLLSLITRLVKDYHGKIALHLITDGRDTGPRTGELFVDVVSNYIAPYRNVKIASVIGRFWAMDRDKRWERTEKAYRLYVEGISQHKEHDCRAALTQQYNIGITDEFIEPVIIDKHIISPEDGVIFFNFREDRMREIVSSLTQKDFPHFHRPVILQKQKTLCFTDYDITFGLPYLFAPQNLNNHLGQVVSDANMTQLRVAETEKYPHVTYFLNGGVELAYPGEIRHVAPSPRDVKTYDLKPQMSAYEVLDIVLQEGIKSKNYDLIVVNFANCDMVGHTGNTEAAIKAVHTVDECLFEIAKSLEKAKGTLIVIADHGNAEQMVQYDTYEPHTAHTTFPVPMIVCDWKNKKEFRLKEDGALCDVAPTILNLLGIKQPQEMSGQSLLEY